MKKKTFIMKNDIGIDIKYTILAYTKDDIIIYTDYMPSDNIMGIRLMSGKIIDEDTFQIQRLSKKEEKDIIDEFQMKVLQTK